MQKESTLPFVIKKDSSKTKNGSHLNILLLGQRKVKEPSESMMWIQGRFLLLFLPFSRSNRISRFPSFRVVDPLPSVWAEGGAVTGYNSASLLSRPAQLVGPCASRLTPKPRPLQLSDFGYGVRLAIANRHQQRALRAISIH